MKWLAKKRPKLEDRHIPKATMGTCIQGFDSRGVGRTLLGAMNAQWRELFECAKCEAFDNHLNSGIKAASHYKDTANGFP